MTDDPKLSQDKPRGRKGKTLSERERAFVKAYLVGPAGVLVNEEQIVGEPIAVCQLELADRSATSGAQVDLVAALDDPPGFSEELVNLLAGNLFGAGSAGRHALSREVHQREEGEAG